MAISNLLRFCPICNGELIWDENSYERMHCNNCNQDFDYDFNHKVWTNEHIVDIAYNDPASTVLSNLFPHDFCVSYTDEIWKHMYYGREVASMEGFLRTLCIPPTEDYAAISELAKLFGINALRVRNVLPDWKESQTLYWENEPIPRESEKYHDLLCRAYDSLFDHSIVFRMALKKYKDKVLLHTIGKNDPKETLLTQSEFMELLNREKARI